MGPTHLAQEALARAERAGRAMPDVANQSRPCVRGTLDRVGMGGIELPLRVHVPGEGMVQVQSRADAYVDLVDPQAKGIHMSRLYLCLHEHMPGTELSLSLIRRVLEFFRDSHHDRSTSGHLNLAFEVMLRRPSLKSDHEGYRAYPVRIESSLVEDVLRVHLTVTVAYSSTCPCSAALARQLIQQQFDRDFAGRESISPEQLRAWLGRSDGVCATPHSQRSYATVTVALAEHEGELDLLGLIDRAEAALQTVVQAAVKREDEQEFARLNGRNLMFCEDAGRRLKAAFEDCPGISDYRIEARHIESLHPHDAVAIVVKGIPGGLRP